MWSTPSNDVCDFCPLDLREFLHVELLCGDFCVLQDFLVHCCIDTKQSAHAGFLSFVLTAHGKDYSVLLSCFALCRSN